jgi:hypothetical protein
LWSAFVSELMLMLALQVQWRLAERRGRRPWLGLLAGGLIERAEATGAARRAGDPRLPLPDRRIKRRLHSITLAFAVLVAMPAIAGIVTAGLGWSLAVAAWGATLWLGLDVLVLAAAIVMTWRGWLPPFDGGDDDDDPEPAPEPGGPWVRAHVYRLKG